MQKASHSHGNLHEKGNKKKRSLQPIEVVLAVAFFAFACAMCAVVAVVATTVVNMYASLSKAATDAADRAATDAAAHVDAVVSGMSPVGSHLSDVIGNAFSTPRIPDTTEEMDAYVVDTASSLDGGMEVVSTATDFGGPSAVAYHLERWNETAESIVEGYFWRTGGLGPVMRGVVDAWNYDIFQAYCVTADGFAVIYPYFPLGTVYVDFSSFPILREVAPEENVENRTVWSDPYPDSLSLQWVVTLMHPMYGTTALDPTEHYVGACGADMTIANVIAYSESVSEHLPWDAYVVLVARDGTVLSIPKKGSDDWGVPNGIEYAELCLETDFDVTKWNAFSTEALSDVGNALESDTTGRSTVSLPGGKRLAAWSVVPEAGWYAIAVIDKKKALAPQRRAIVSVIVTSSVLGTLIAASAIVGAVYVVVRRQYARLNIKIVNLSEEIVDLQSTLSEMSGGERDAEAITALSGGIRTILTTLREMAANETPARARVLRDVAKMLIHRNFGDVRLAHALDDDQLQFVRDCGMTVKVDSDDGVSILGDTSVCGDGGDAMRLGDVELSPSDDRSFGDVSIVDVSSWNFDVFNIDKDRHGSRMSLRTVALSVLDSNGFFGRGASDSTQMMVDPLISLRLFSHMEDTYCGRPTDDLATCSGAAVLPRDADMSFPSEEDPFLNLCQDGPNDTPVFVENPYHNSAHAADVTQAFNCMLQTALADSQALRNSITKDDILAGIIASAGHDYGHPGTNNSFMKETMSAAHVLFSGDSTLERMHASRTFSLVFRRGGAYDILSTAAGSKKKINEIHATATKLVLSTDMARHAEILGAFEGWHESRIATVSSSSEPPKSPRTKSTTRIPIDDGGKLLVLQMIMKAADLGNAFREWNVCLEWTKRISEEFLKQGKSESEMGLPVSKYMDGSVSNAKMQDTFIPFIVLPLLQALSKEFPSFSKYEDRAWDNLKRWRATL